RIPIRANWLRPSQNVLEITTIQLDQPDPADLRVPQPLFGRAFGSGIYWGGLALQRAESDRIGKPHVELRPLPLYVSRDDHLNELVDLVVTAPGGFQSGEAHIIIADQQLQVDLETGGRTFGQFRERVEIDALDAPAAASVVVK